MPSHLHFRLATLKRKARSGPGLGRQQVKPDRVATADALPVPSATKAIRPDPKK